MNHTITVLPSGQQFRSTPDEAILFSAIAAQVSVPYGCRGGLCGVCRAKVVQGTFSGGRSVTAAAGDAKAEGDGDVLLCTARATSDMTIECRELTSSLPVKGFPARIESITYPAADVARVLLRAPRLARFEYTAGQYVEVRMADDGVRCYSLASPFDPNSTQLELHVRHVPGGKFSGRFFGDLARGDVLHLRAPHGSFTMDFESDSPVIMVVGGTGFAPAKALIETAIGAGGHRRITLYWGGRQRQDLYMAQLCKEWENKLDFRFVPVLWGAGSKWTGRTGYVQDAVLADQPDLSQHEVYACGGPALIAAARSSFVERGRLPAERFHADTFINEADRLGLGQALALES